MRPRSLTTSVRGQARSESYSRLESYIGNEYLPITKCKYFFTLKDPPLLPHLHTSAAYKLMYIHIHIYSYQYDPSHLTSPHPGRALLELAALTGAGRSHG